MGKLAHRQGRFQGWEYSETMTSGTDGDTVKIPSLEDGKVLSVSLIISTVGEGKIQFTTSPDASVAAGTCNWQDWPEGSSTVTVSDALVAPVSGIRLVRVSGTVIMELII